MSNSKSDGFTKYVYTAQKEPTCSLKSKRVIKNTYEDPKALIEKMYAELKALSKSNDPKEKDLWIDKSVLELENHINAEKNKIKHAALTQLITKISPS